MPKNYYYDMSIFKQWFERKRRQKFGKFKRLVEMKNVVIVLIAIFSKMILLVADYCSTKSCDAMP